MDASEDKKDQGTAEFIRDHSVRLAGVGQFIGDTALIAFGEATKKRKITSVGVLGYTAGTIGTRYGNPKAEKQLAIVEHQLGKYLRQQGVEIPADPTLEKLKKPGGVIDAAESFLYAYPTQLINACFSLMGVQFARSGIQDHSKMLTASGALLISAGLAGLLIQEKKPDPEHPPQGAMQKIGSWIREKPLRVTGILANLNQVTLAMDAWHDRKDHPKAYLLKFLAVGGFVMCNTMLGLSSKGEGGGAQMDEATRSQLTTDAARVIAAQPKEVQKQVLEHVAGYMASQPYVHKSAAEISKLLYQKLDDVKKAMPAQDWQAKASRTGQDCHCHR